MLLKNFKRIYDERFTIMYLDEFNDDYLNISIYLKSKYEKIIAYIFNVSTNIDYRKNDKCKKLISHILERLVELGINKAVLQTEKIYKRMEFKEILRAIKYTTCY